MAGGIGYGADNCDRVGATVISRRRSVESPGSPNLNRLVRFAASNHRCGGVDHSHFLAALSALAANFGGLSDPRRIKGRAAMTGGIGYRADYRDGIAAPVV